MNKTHLFTIIPYLKTSDSIIIRGFKFESSRNIEAYTPEVREHLEILFSMFYLRDDLRIKDMTFNYIECEDDVDIIENYMKKFIDIQTLLAYIYSSPNPTFLDPYLTNEHSNIFSFIPKNVSKFIVWPDNNVENTNLGFEFPKINDRNEVSGYQGRLNGNSYLFVAKGSKIYPPSPNFWLNIPQNLYREISSVTAKQSALSKLLWKNEITNNNEYRIFTSLKWYNRSLSYDVNQDIALINLAIAFESLLGLEQGEHVTKRFKESIKLLVGNIEKLDSWLNQFYNARSEIVHEGSSKNLLFNAGNDKKNTSYYRSLVSYGRLIFKICLNAIVTGTESAYEIGLPNLFITNKERFEHIIKKLDASNASKELLFSIKNDINDIERYFFVHEDGLKVDLIIGTLKRVIKVFLDIGIDASDEFKNLFYRFVDKKEKSELYHDLSIIKKMNEQIKIEKEQLTNDDSCINIVISLIKCVWNYTFDYFYRLERQYKNKDIKEQI